MIEIKMLVIEVPVDVGNPFTNVSIEEILLFWSSYKEYIMR